MTYKGVVKGHVIEFEGDADLPEGTRVSITPGQQAMTLSEWLSEARLLRTQLSTTSDSVEMLRQLRQRRASR